MQFRPVNTIGEIQGLKNILYVLNLSPSLNYSFIDKLNSVSPVSFCEYFGHNNLSQILDFYVLTFLY